MELGHESGHLILLVQRLTMHRILFLYTHIPLGLLLQVLYHWLFIIFRFCTYIIRQGIPGQYQDCVLTYLSLLNKLWKAHFLSWCTDVLVFEMKCLYLTTIMTVYNVLILLSVKHSWMAHWLPLVTGKKLCKHFCNLMENCIMYMAMSKWHLRFHSW